MSDDSKKSLLKQAGILAIAGVISRIIGMLYRGPLKEIIGKTGNGYYSGAYAIYNIVLLISAYSIPSAMSKLISSKLAVGEYRNAHKIFKCALSYVAVVGGLGSLVLFFGSNLIAVDEYSAFVMKFFAPTIFAYGFLGVLRGYSQAHKNMVPTSVSQLYEQIFNAVVSVAGAYFLTSLAGNGNLAKRAAYGAVGSSLGTGAGVLVALVYMIIVYNKNKAGIHGKIHTDTHDEISGSGAFKLIIAIVTPFILSSAIYNLSTSLNNTVFLKLLVEVKGVESDVATGMYGLFGGEAVVLTNLPIALSAAAASAMMPDISSSFARKNKEEAVDTVSGVMRIILMISIPCAVGLFALAKPVVMILFPQPDTVDRSAVLLMWLAITVVFYSVSTVSNAVLQAIGKVNVPVVNAAIALVVQTVVLVPLVLFTDLNEIALCIVVIVYSLIMCVLNNMEVSKHIVFTYDIKKAYVLPSLSAVIMGIVAYLIHSGANRLCNMVLGRYLSNAVATAIAVIIAIVVYFAVLIKLGGATREDIRKFPKGTKIVRVLEKIKLL